MPGKFNQTLWKMGHDIENNIYPLLNKKWDCDLYRSNDIFDVFDFCDNNKKIIVEIKGRNTPSNKYNGDICWGSPHIIDCFPLCRAPTE